MTVSPATLPLDLDPETFSTLGREMLNLATDWLENETTEPLLESISGSELAALFDEAPPPNRACRARRCSPNYAKRFCVIRAAMGTHAISPMSAPHPIRWVR